MEGHVRKGKKKGTYFVPARECLFGLIPDCMGISLMAASYMKMPRT